MKRVISILLTAVMAMSIMAVPAFADVVEEYGVSVTFGEPAGIGVQSTDKWGYKSYIKNNDYKNVSVKSLSECPKMDYVKTIEGVTFSNYIRHTERNSTDYAGNPIKIYYVYIGLDGAMRSNKDSVEFMTDPGKEFNNLNENVKGVTGQYSHACSDLNMYKTNTACLSSSSRFDGKHGLTYLYDIGITPYTNGERNMDGTWNEGLTWVFKYNVDFKTASGGYSATYPIRVNQGDTVTYFLVFVTNGTNYSGQRVTDSNPVTPPPTTTDPVTVAPAKEATAQPTTSPIYINNVKTNFEAYNINGNNYFKLRDVALALRDTQKQFEVGWDGEKNAISLSSRTPYSGKAGTVSTSKQQRKASRTNSAIYVDGVKKDFTAYQINGNNFFKLRDLGQTFDFNVGWDSATQSVTIDTTKTYK